MFMTEQYFTFISYISVIHKQMFPILQGLYHCYICVCVWAFIPEQWTTRVGYSITPERSAGDTYNLVHVSAVPL